MASIGSDYDEKRNFIRMFVNADVRITEPTTGNIYEGKGKNLSGDGAMFTSKEAFKIGQRLELHISSDLSKLSSLNAVFEVKRVEMLEGGEYQVGGIMLDVK